MPCFVFKKIYTSHYIPYKVTLLKQWDRTWKGFKSRHTFDTTLNAISSVRMTLTFCLLSSSIFSKLVWSLFLSCSSSRTLFCSFMNTLMSLAAFSTPISYTEMKGNTQMCITHLTLQLYPDNTDLSRMYTWSDVMCKVMRISHTSTCWIVSSVSPTSDIEMEGKVESEPKLLRSDGLLRRPGANYRNKESKLLGISIWHHYSH